MEILLKKTLFGIALSLLAQTQLFSKTRCFIAYEKGSIISQEGNPDERFAPCSTFKIALSLMAFHEGILVDETHPQWEFKDGYVDYVAGWKEPQTPLTWMKKSCVWYSHLITAKLGAEKFKQYVEKFSYGNKDISGDPGKNNGLTCSWLSSSLKISPREQVEFLQKLIDTKVPVSTKAHELTKSILFVEEFKNGWQLYGKTGSGSLPTGKPFGWFVGWITNRKRTIVYAHVVELESGTETPAGQHAREGVREKLAVFI